MAVNGIEIQVGQKWRTRDGRIAEITGNDGHDEWPWDHTLGSCGDDGFEYDAGDESDCDLIELIEHADGFKPWAGGEQPAHLDRCMRLMSMTMPPAALQQRLRALHRRLDLIDGMPRSG